jgi:NAD(P)-dependent dehydrogenase (short-subunit alcohol dehydrogenase family)
MTGAPPSLSQLCDLSGKVAVVTGAGKGIGEACAARFHEAGAKVLCLDIDEAAAVAVAKGLGDEEVAAGVRADVRERDDLQAAAAAAVERWGRIDILVNSAGMFPPAPLLQMTPEQWDTVLDVNTKGTFLASQACAPRMHETAGGGAIVNIASKSAYQPTPGMGHYAASKGGVKMLTKALALELSPLGIRVNAVAPGGVATETAGQVGAALLASSPELAAKGAQFASRCPMGRSAEPDEIARVVMFLATDWSSYMTGETVLADGGYLLT